MELANPFTTLIFSGPSDPQFSAFGFRRRGEFVLELRALFTIYDLPFTIYLHAFQTSIGLPT